MEARKWSWRFKFGEISEHDAQIFCRTWRISGPEVADGAKPDVPTTDRQNEKKKKHRPFYEAVDARRRLKIISTLTTKATCNSKQFQCKIKHMSNLVAMLSHCVWAYI